MTTINPVEIIQLKKRGMELSHEQLQGFLTSYLQGGVEEYQLSAFLMAVWFRGMTNQETFALTEVMRDSGRRVNFDNIKKIHVDKHSTGGVGDKTSLILGPLVAAAGIPVPMMAGRGLAHTGGTIDKLEAIPGFRTEISLEDFKKNVETYGFCIMGQSKEICPADKKIYALRDVTATVDSLPLICASIMSKKIAEGIKALVLDVKVGSGAFMKTPEAAKELATHLIRIGELGGLKVRALVTSMNQPLGSYVGNALEIKECLEIMEGKKKLSRGGLDLYSDTRELTLQLAAEMIVLGGKAKNLDEAYRFAEELLRSGQALENFYKMCEFQGPAKIKNLPQAPNCWDLKSGASGFVSEMNVELIGRAAVELGAGRLKTSDSIDPTVGFEFLVKLGSPVEKGQELVRIHFSDSQKLESTKKLLSASIVIKDQKPTEDLLVFEKL